MNNPKDNATNSGSDATEAASFLTYTPIPSIAPLVESAHQLFHTTRITHSYDFRISQLRGIERLIRENTDALSDAIAKDLGQGLMYCEAFELSHVISRSRYAQANLRKWMASQRTPTPFPMNLNMPVYSEVAPHPRGVVLIITPWNLPIQLTLNPLMDAISAGNVCVVKMSERCVHCTRLLSHLLTCGEYVDARVIKVVIGGAEEATELLNQRVDVISYTGGIAVGRKVALAAARHLTPVLLELGGKNPVFVTRNAHLPSAAMRIAWAKITGNAGQMCVCPEYVLIEECVKEEFTSELCKAMDRMYPVSSYSNGTSGDHFFGDVGKMISVQHAERVVNLIDSTCEVIYGGVHHNVKERFVAPTIVEATANSTIMKEEIFGPILAMITVTCVDEGIQFVNQHYTSKAEHPLALYIFSKSKYEQRKIMDAVPSGTCGINDLIKQAANYYQPFGGVGTSGIGAYNGKHGFDFFSHYRGTLLSSNTSTYKYDPSVWVAHPPFDEKKLFLFRFIGNIPLVWHRLKRILPVVILVIVVGVASFCFYNPKFLINAKLIMTEV